MRPFVVACSCLFIALLPINAAADSPQGYYRQPAVRGDTIVFCAEGDLWVKVGGSDIARRLTTHLGDEMHPSISPDGARLAFSAQYEGPTEVYSMPIEGGLPTRHTWEGGRALVVGWTPDGRVIHSTRHYSTLPDAQLVLTNVDTNEHEVVALAQAADGSFAPDGTLFFTRLPFQGSHTKRYKGGTAQQVWKWSGPGREAVNLSADWPGTSKEPMARGDRVYFASDRDGTMNIWSMTHDGGDLRQHTRHEGFDVQSPDLDGDSIVYQVGADLWRYDIARDAVTRLTIGLPSDFDQMREKWISAPLDWVTSAHLAPDGERAVFTARGQVFVAPRGQGRLVQVTRDEAERWRDARFMPDGKTLLAMSDRSGEVEFWTLPADGLGETRQVTSDGVVIRWEGVPSPDGKWIAHHDKNLKLWLLDVETGEQRLLDTSNFDENFGDLAWSPDSKWLAFARTADNSYRQVWLLRVADGFKTAVTSDRQLSFSPAWSPDGDWLYFLSSRHLETSVRSPWGPRAPKPHFTDTVKIYALALDAEAKFPFLPKTELDEPAKPTETMEEEKHATDPIPASGEPADPAAEQEPPATPEVPKTDDAGVLVEIDLEGLVERLYEVPTPNGEYDSLIALKDRLLFMSRAGRGQGALRMLKIDRNVEEPKTIVDGATSVELSFDGKRLLVRKGDAWHSIDSNVGPNADLKDTAISTSGWTFPVDPAVQWRQMFTEAWRLERDYFYDQDMHGVDWKAMHEKYLPLVERVRTRAELSDLIAQMVAELSALHTFVSGGDLRRPDQDVAPASLGARLRRSAEAGGWVVEHIHRADPEYPSDASPLARPEVGMKVGDVITMVNGVNTLDVPHVNDLLRNQAGRQVRLRVKQPDGQERDVIVHPITQQAAANLRYSEWEHTRRGIVEEQGAGNLGYVHLRAMGANDINQWTRDFYPVFDRKGLIIDVRDNGGGNIDSWILSELQRQAWFYWQGRVGDPYWNMQYAFRGHIVILCNESTGSDGEAITEGIRRLKLGTIIGTRTWGGEIWLSSSNFLVDRGIATASEYGVYGPEGVWLIEGHGVDPDIVVDNPPHATFNGEDAQLAAAIEFLKNKIEAEPVEVPPAPPHPDKSR